MRILFITHYDNMYGANRALCKLIRLMKTEYGHEPMLVIPSEGEFTDSLKDLNIKYLVSGVTQWQAEYSTPLRFLAKKIIRRNKIKKEVKDIYSFFKEDGVDVVHSNSSVIGHGAMLSKLFKSKHIWHIREFSKEHYNMSYFYNKSYVKDAYEAADRLITISDSIKDNYKLKYPSAKISRVYDGVSGEYNKDYSAKDVPTFVYTAYLYSMKHQDTVIDAVKILKDKNVTGFRVLLAGGGKDEYKSYLQKKIEDYNLENVEILGYVDDMEHLLDNADIGIMASEYEGFGLVTVEYMLHGMPVIGFDSGATPEIICDKQTGYIYKTKEELAMCMERLASDSELRVKLGQAGKQRAKELFTEENNAAGIVNVYKEISGNE